MVEGKLYDGQTSQSQQVTLEENGEFGLKLTMDNKSHLITWDDIKVSDRLGNSARYIELKTYGRFETRDNDGVDQLIENHSDYRRGMLLHKMENSYRWITSALVVTIIFSFSVVKWGVPWLADTIAHSLPDKTTDYIQNKAFEQFEKNFLKPSELSAKRQAEIVALHESVIKKFNAEEKNYRFMIRKASDGIGANAFAFPSGVIVMTDQLIELADNDTQIVGVLAHEVGHLEEKHSLRQIIRGSMLTILAAWISGDVSGTLSGVITAPVALLELSYSREFETEADSYSIHYFDCNYGQLDEMARFFAKMDSQFEKDKEQRKKEEALGEVTKTESDFLSSHPATEKRMAMLTSPHNHTDCLSQP